VAIEKGEDNWICPSPWSLVINRFILARRESSLHQCQVTKSNQLGQNQINPIRIVQSMTLARFIVKHCYGIDRVGQVVAERLFHDRDPFVLIDPDIENVAKAKKLGYLVIHGNADDSDLLEQAGIRDKSKQSDSD